ncbi:MULTISPECIES: DUF6999 family protein [Micromonospora]|uniref:Uncharacterized protein n=1 Tax=Micromonospora yangpuensis TaxID=683228 RepID=A0A1C6V9Z3_9ACTN|nr:hypothetical protein [Micromonospora yangpuensis]GGM22549.1 hypothetical protein GCM10012279_46120 [Micromonospora yangpuensis]SCL63149.1 hypothetical protein GA0070617_5119 [Micromonospora yangpuensis]
MTERTGTRRREPSVWQAIMADPTVPIGRRTLELVVADQRRWSRSWLYPWVRIMSRLAVTLIGVVKRLLPWQLRAHATMDTLCVWFLRRFVSPEAGELLIRHFVVETRLLNFVVRNAGVPGLREVELLPTNLRQLGDRAVIEHDLNVYDVLIGLGDAATPQGGLLRYLDRRGGPLDTSMLTVPPLDAEPGRRRLLNLDIQTALCLMNIPFALCLTRSEYRRAVHSMRLDTSLLALLTQITGDPTFLSWRPAGPVLRVDSTIDVPQAVYEHAVICEYAFARLIALDTEVTAAPTTRPTRRQRPSEPGLRSRPVHTRHRG